MSTPADPAAILRQFSPKHDFFIGIDSDGCVFDSMEIKQKECFCPEFILHYDLQRVARAARECWEFVNLYSRSRGINRFTALLEALDLLRERPEVTARQAQVPQLEGLRKWVSKEAKLGNATLKTELARTGDADLERVWNWSNAVNAAVERIVKDVPPFPTARAVFEAAQPRADLLVISQTPTEALNREWAEHGIEHYVRLIAGQELGTKTEHIGLAASGKYVPERILMIGDAPGDYKAARNNNALFYPIVPGREETCWQRLLTEGLGKFFNGTFAGGYQAELIAEFEASLPALPPWKVGEEKEKGK